MLAGKSPTDAEGATVISCGLGPSGLEVSRKSLWTELPMDAMKWGNDVDVVDVLEAKAKFRSTERAVPERSAAVSCSLRRKREINTDCNLKSAQSAGLFSEPKRNRSNR